MCLLNKLISVNQSQPSDLHEMISSISSFASDLRPVTVNHCLGSPWGHRHIVILKFRNAGPRWMSTMRRATGIDRSVRDTILKKSQSA